MCAYIDIICVCINTSVYFIHTYNICVYINIYEIGLQSSYVSHWRD